MKTVTVPAVVATVVRIEGQVSIRAASGEVRVAAPGNKVSLGDAVVTAPGAHAEVVLPDSRHVALEAEGVYRLEPTSAEVEQVIQALETGGDIGEELEATAAGLGLGGAGDSGHSFVRLVRVSEGTEPLAYEFPSAPEGGVLLPFGAVAGREAGAASIATEPPSEPPVPPDTLPTLQPAAGVVYEAALPGGTSPASPTERTSGTLVFTTGEDIPVTLSVGEIVIGSPETMIQGEYGKLYVSPGGEWEYVLDGSADHGEMDVVKDRFEISITDSDGSVAASSLVIDITDDGPMIEATGGTIANAIGAVLNDAITYQTGADGLGRVDLSGNIAPEGLTSEGEAVQYRIGDSNLDGLDELTAYAGGRTVFTLTPDEGGSYKLTMADTLDLPMDVEDFGAMELYGGPPAQSHDFMSPLGEEETPMTVRFTDPFWLDDPKYKGGINPSGAGVGLQNNNMEEGEALDISFHDAAGRSMTVNDVRLHVHDIGAGGEEDHLVWNAYRGGVEVDSGRFDDFSERETLGGIEVEGGYDTLRITTPGGGYKLSVAGGETEIISGDELLNFQATITDADRDFATDTFQVLVTNPADEILREALKEAGQQK